MTGLAWPGLAPSLYAWSAVAVLAAAWVAGRRVRAYVRWSRAQAREVREWLAETEPAWARAVADARADVAALAALRAARAAGLEPAVRALRPFHADIGGPQ